MVMKTLICVLVCIGFMFLNASFAETMPNTFTAGTPAKAAEVNENFQFVNYGNIVLVDKNGVELGTYLGGTTRTSSLQNGNPLYYESYMTSTGYIVNANTYSYELPEVTLQFRSTDCTGDPYTPVSEIGFGTRLGMLVRNNNNVYYIAKSPQILESVDIIHSIKGLYPNSGCNTASWNITGVQIYKLYPNDPSITGESESIKLGPFGIKRRGN